MCSSMMPGFVFATARGHVQPSSSHTVGVHDALLLAFLGDAKVDWMVKRTTKNTSVRLRRVASRAR
jgi:hypothetical protein